MFLKFVYKKDFKLNLVSIKKFMESKCVSQQIKISVDLLP